MLQSISKHVQGWIAGVIIALLAVVFLLFGVEYYLQAGTGKDATVIKVNGTKISYQVFNQMYQNMLNSQRTRSGVGQVNKQVRDQLRQMAVQQLIASTAVLNAALDAGFRVSEQMAKQVLVQNPQFQENGQFSRQRFMQIMYANNLTPQAYLDNIKSTMVTQQLAEGLTSSSFVLPKALQHAYQLIHQRRSFGFAVLHADAFKGKVKISPQDAKTQYVDNQKAYTIPAKVKVSYLLLDPTVLEKAVNITDKDITNYYEGNKTSFSTPKRWQVQVMVYQLAPDASTSAVNNAKAKMAKLIKAGKADKSNGNISTTTQWLGEDQVPAQLANVINSLSVQQSSKPFRTRQGLTIIKLLAVQPGKTQPLSAVKARIVQMLKQQKIRQKFTNMSQQLTNLSYTNPTSLRPAANALGLKIQESDWLTKQGNAKGLFANKNVLTELFSDTVFKQRNNSNPIELKDGAILVVRVKAEQPAKIQPFTEVKDKIIQKMLIQRAQREAGVVAYQLQAKLAKAKDIAAILKQNQLKWDTRTNVQKTDSKTPNVILQAVFGLAQPSKTQPYPTAVTQLPDGDFAIVRLTAVKLPNLKQVGTKALQQLRNSLARFRGQVEYTAYARGVIKSAKVKIYKSAMNQ